MSLVFLNWFVKKDNQTDIRHLEIILIAFLGFVCLFSSWSPLWTPEYTKGRNSEKVEVFTVEDISLLYIALTSGKQLVS